jgi:HD-GYP domain-containing protein (c-di-GMP phosphodiesterase class II)
LLNPYNVGEAIDKPLAGRPVVKERSPRRWLPIRVKITLPYLILALALAVGSAYVVTQIVFDSIDERFTNQLIESGKLASEGMVSQERQLLSSLRLIAHAQGVAEAIQAGDTAQTKELTIGIIANAQEEWVALLDKGGDLVLGVRAKQGGKPGDYEFATQAGLDFKQWDFVQRALAGQEDRLGDKFSGVMNVDGEPILVVAGPAYNRQGEVSGAVLVGKPLSSLVDQIHNQIFAHVTLYDFKGQPMASTLVDSLGIEPARSTQILTNQDRESQRRNLTEQRRLTSSHIPYDEILGPWEVRGGQDLGLLGVSLPKSFLVQTSTTTRLQVTGLVAAALILVIVLGVNVANIITRPLLRLVRASQQVAEGDLEVQVDPRGDDEVAELTRSFNHMVTSLNESKMDLLKAYDSTLEGWSTALELRDRETEGHTQRVTDMTLQLAEAMGASSEELVDIRRGALLHDIGKMGIPDSILLSTGTLSAQEWEIMRKHPVYAYELLWPIEYLRPALEIPLCHHERWDGKGYPRGLKGEEIPLAARIFAVVDVWDAMRSDRPYRKALPDDEVCQYIWESAGSQFDPEVVKCFFRLLGRQC